MKTLLAGLLLLPALATALVALPSDPVIGHQLIADGQGGLPAILTPSLPQFGRAVAPLGDFDGDGVDDVLVGIPHWIDGGAVEGGVAILLLNPDGTVKGHHMLEHGDFEVAFGDPRFGAAVCSLGDLDGDGVEDLAIGQPRENYITFAFDPVGVVWIAFMNADGTIKGKQAITEGYGGFTGTVGDDDEFGSAVANVGDLDGDGVTDLAVGAPAVKEGGGPDGTGQGRVWLLFLNADGTVRSHQTIDQDELALAAFDGFGFALAHLGEGDAAGEIRLAVGAPRDDDGGTSRGVVWLLSVDATGAVTSSSRLGSSTGVAGISDDDSFGRSLAALGDWNGDGIGCNLAVGSPGDDVGGTGRGSIRLLTLTFDSSIQTQVAVSDTSGGFTGALADLDAFGMGVALLGDLDGDGHRELAVGAPFGGVDDDLGALWILFTEQPLPPYWVNLGKGLVGTPGIPELIGTGVLQAGSPVSVILRDALPNSMASLVIGFTELGAPFKGGTLVPSPDALVTGFPTGPSGTVIVGTTWPQGVPAGFGTFLQWWIADAGAPAGLAASNAIKGIAQ